MEIQSQIIICFQNINYLVLQLQTIFTEIFLEKTARAYINCNVLNIN
jgi:hypothetical protein